MEIACNARDLYKENCSGSSCDSNQAEVLKNRPILVAASVGSYGAYLADGSEYRLVKSLEDHLLVPLELMAV